VKIAAESYDEMRRWLSVVFAIGFELPGRTPQPESHPLAVLDNLSKVSMSKARAGLGMAIGDMIEMSGGWPRDAVLKLDQELVELGLPSLSEVRIRFGKQLRTVLRRGEVKTEEEYYLLRGAADLPDQPSDKIWPLLAAYEVRTA
jgi:hypothetical protein